MNILDKLLKSDAQPTYEKRVFYSKMAQRFTGDKEPVPFTVTGLDYNKINRLIGKQFDKHGNFDPEKAARAKSLTAIEGIIDENGEPLLKNQELCRHFSCGTPADLAEKLFGLELNSISDIICELSGISMTEEEAQEEADEIKNR